MTDNDKRQQKAMLLLECQEAIQEIADYEENAKRLAGYFREMADWLNTASGEVIGPKAEAEKLHVKLSGYATSEFYVERLDFSNAQEAVRLIMQSRLKLSKLRERKNALRLR